MAMFASFLARAVLLAVAAAAGMPGPAVAGPQSGAGAPAAAPRVSVMVKVTIPPVLRVRAVGQPDNLAVTAADVERGFVDVGNARLQVFSNQRGSVRLVAAVASPFAQAVEITGLPHALVARPLGEAPVARGDGPSERGFQVHYRIRLARDTAPGLYPWPVFLSLEAW